MDLLIVVFIRIGLGDRMNINSAVIVLKSNSFPEAEGRMGVIVDHLKNDLINAYEVKVNNFGTILSMRDQLKHIGNNVKIKEKK